MTDTAPADSSIASRRRFVIVLLVILGALFFIPGIGTVHLFDWDEANFAESSREMIETGNYSQVTIGYEPFYEKPPLFFWLQVLSMKLFGVNEFGARMVNACCGITTLVTVFLIGSAVYGSLFGFLWALAFFGSFLPHLFFKSGIIDPVFNLLIFLGLTLIAKSLLTGTTGKPDKKPHPLNRRLPLFALAGIFIGLAMLAKGPVALLVIGLTMVVFWAMRRFKPFVSIPEIVVFLLTTTATATIFFGVETLAHGTAFLRHFIAYQIHLFSTGDAGQGRPIYFHAVVILFGCFPASFFAIISFFKREESEARQHLFNRLMLILFWVVLILFSIVRTKTVLYSSLTWFPLTYLAALSLHTIVKEKRALSRPLAITLALFALFVGAVITAFPILIMHKQWIVPLIPDKFALACLDNPVHWSGFEFLLGIGYAAAALLSLRLYQHRRPFIGTFSLFGASALCLFLFSAIFTGKIERYCQGGPIAFYQTHSTENCYVRSLFKSYTDLFYGRKKLSDRPESRSREWLLRGPIDKPAFFVCRNIEAGNWDKDTTVHLEKIKEEYGFVYYRRER